MSNLIRLVVSNYNEILESNRDPMVDTWPLMGSPGPILIILSIYLLFVLKVGPKIMENRPAFQLKNLMIWYNAIQVVFSIWLTSLAFETNITDLVLPNTCSSKGTRSSKLQHLLSNGAWWYFFAKIIELLDTVGFINGIFSLLMVFFVLRKKQNQVTFLHVYHHTITALFSWCYLKLLPGEQGILIGLLNSSVHIVMYTYYMIAAMGPKYRKYLWWKKYITVIQLIQFGLMLVYLLMVLAMDCLMPKALTYFFAANVIIFIFLFTDFYRKAYTKKKEA